MKPILIDLTPYYGILRISGPDAFNFLQGQLTCDIREITETELKLGGHCNLKGRLRVLYRIFKKNDAYYLELPLSVLTYGMSQLKLYAKFSKVTIEEVSDQWQIWGGVGKSLLPMDLPSYTTHLTLPFSPERFQILYPKTNSQAFTAFLTSIPHQTAEFERWKLLDIQQEIPEIWPETIEQFLPHHINLPQLGGVSFNKGCYCGQEIVARMEYRGNIKRTLRYLKLPHRLDIPLPGTILYNNINEEVGLVVMSAASQLDKSVEVLAVASLAAKEESK